MATKKVESYQDLVVWQKSHDLALDLFKTKFGKKDDPVLISKLRETAIIVPTNISIGFKKRNKKPKVHYYRAALTGIEELEYLLVLAKDLELIKDIDTMLEELETTERMLKRLIRANTTPT